MIRGILLHTQTSRIGIVSFWLSLFVLSGTVTVTASPRGEYEVKAAFILNFILLTDWPEDVSGATGNEILLCVVSGRGLPQPFKSLDGNKVGAKSIRVVARMPDTTLPACQAIFYREDVGTESIVRTLTAVRTQPVLTIGENSKVTQLGGTIHFYKDNDRLRFAINPKVVSDQGLKMSSRLLQIATLIND